MSNGIDLDSILEGLGDILSPLLNSITTPESLPSLLDELGWDTSDFAITKANASVVEIEEEIQKVYDEIDEIY